jgi:catechol 2,3-dioxygenase
MDSLTTQLPTSLTLGAVHLSVSELPRSLAFYQGSIGLSTLESFDGGAILGVGETQLLVLVEEPGARRSAGAAGLFHFALRVPTRRSLARWLAHAAHERVPLTGLSDHFVSEAIYLDDPDGHGIEIYWDRPRAHWENLVAERVTTIPLDTASLMRELGDEGDGFHGMPDGTDMGQVHIRVGDVAGAVGFYEGVVGFDLMAAIPGAAFLAVGGYHHHLGVNSWQSLGATAATTGSARLLHATLVLPDRASVDAAAARIDAAGHGVETHADGVLIHDPFGTALVLTAA